MIFRRNNNKYGVSIVAERTADNIAFDSKLEMHRYLELKLLEKAKKIKGLIIQPAFELQPGFRKNNQTYRAIKYIADFQYYDLEKKMMVIEDCKGMETEVFKMKHKMFEYIFQDLSLEIIT